MLFSLEWLGELCGLEGLEPPRIAAALTARGLTVDATTRFGDDTILDVDVPANRPDCLGHLGLARELAAAFQVALRPRAKVVGETGEPIDHRVRVRIDDPILCPRYTARLVRAVRVGPSPSWVVSRLEGCGLRSINNVVDASNLVLLELGHPIHTFDFSRIAQGTIVVRRARAGEALTTLDGVERALTPEVLVIADADTAVALAGIMGGASSEIRESTRDVLIEAAYFEPRSIRATARRLALSTDASHRFERGVDPEGVLAAQDLAVKLLVDLAEGEPAAGLLDVQPCRAPGPRMTLRPERVRLLLGFDPGPEAITDALSALKLAPRAATGGRISVSIPSWRVDLEREADLVEEVARHIGYDRIPAKIPGDLARGMTGADSSAEERARDALAHAGFHEAIHYSMIGEGEDDAFVARADLPPVGLLNPIAEQLSRLRRSLLPGLLRSADLNLRRGRRDVRLFEVGPVFLARSEGGFPCELLRAGIAWSGAAQPRHWSSRSRDVDLHDVAGLVELVMDVVRPGVEPKKRPTVREAFHPGRGVAWTSDSGREWAWCGELHPELREKLDIGAPVYLAEVELGLLVPGPTAPPKHAPFARVPGVSRDLSLVLAPGIPFEKVLGALREVPAPSPVRFEALDRYEGPPLSPGEVALTVRVMLEPLERTLTDLEVEDYCRVLVGALEARTGARLRG